MQYPAHFLSIQYEHPATAEQTPFVTLNSLS